MKFTLFMFVSFITLAAGAANECYVTDSHGTKLLSREGRPVRYNGTGECKAMVKKFSPMVIRSAPPVVAPVVVEKKEVVQPPVEEKAVVAFDTASSALTPAQKKSLEAIIKTLKSGEATAVEITGFADVRGASNYNQQLSHKRAQAVKQWLSQNGIKDSQIKAVGGGVKNSKSMDNSRVAEIQVVR